MSKFTIFTLFLSATIVVIVAELLVNEYIKYPGLQKQVTASVFHSQAPSATAGSSSATAQIGASVGTSAPEGTATIGNISFSLINDAGFKDISLQRVPFNGILFEIIDLRDFNSVPIVTQNLLQNNRIKVGTFYEFAAGSRLLSREVYQLLKDKAGKVIGASVNETNSFGDGSFYVNPVDHPDSVFLVVKSGDSVYSLAYLKDLHPQVKNLLAKLHAVSP
jgi:hypothetical protein